MKSLLTHINENLNEAKTDHIEELRNASENVKLTSAQKSIVDKLLSGLKIITVNTHRANGGEWCWIRIDDGIENENTIYPAGSVYKAFWNTMRVLKLDANNYISNNRSVKFKF